MESLEFKWTKATLLLTVLAVILALLSLMLEWYSCTVTVYTDHGSYETDYQFSVTGVLGSGGVDYYARAGFGSIGDLLGIVAILLVFWAFASVPYISTIFEGDSGFVLGWILMALAVAPLASYALFIGAAADADISGVVRSEISSGPLVASFAVTLQVAAIAVRQAQVLNPRFAHRKEMTQEELGAGDLPVRFR
ncbi:MAG: hypothetical protein MUC90_03190 [Thermoplasmata archaeon]|jgi:hypothetical protein|nr:hypothetical protein [Thermoplasmata archaeon]